MKEQVTRRKFLNKSFALATAGALGLFTEKEKGIFIKEAKAAVCKKDTGFANCKPKYTKSIGKPPEEYSSVGSFMTGTTDPSAGCYKFGTNTPYGKSTKKVCTSACHASCHSSCHSSCHGSCHGSRGWR